MPSDRVRDLCEPGTAGADINPPPSLTKTKTVATVLTEEFGYLRQRARTLYEATDELADLGFAWKDVATLVGVSVAAIQKWRRGEGMTGENRQQVASLLAACDLVCEHYGSHEVAAWFAMPVQLGVPVTPVDLWAGGRSDLVLDFASGHPDSERILTDWDPR
ncbi:MAG: hypothetical protein ACRDQX_12150 [Pseudonocardiaceae bacterium]